MSFLDFLTPAERQAFISVAHEQTFVRGARIMVEGEPADHVIVILQGWTRITLHMNGVERVIAERGPGQLVGERGALQVNVRSANVIALGPVRVLMMRTPDFASFIDAHPRVLTFIEGQIYDRLTREPARDALVGPSGTFQPQPAGFRAAPVRRLPVEEPRRRLTGENCTILLTDVVGFGALDRNDQDRRIIRLSSQEMMRASLGRVWDECISEDRGDGLLIVVPPHITTAQVIGPLHRELPGELRRHNRTYSEMAHIRLRVAVNVGPVVSDVVGMSGEAIIRTARLIDAPAFKGAMNTSGATLGIIASEFVYETAIRHAAGSIESNGYKLVNVNVKESNIPGWMQLIDLASPESQPGDPLRTPVPQPLRTWGTGTALSPSRRTQGRTQSASRRRAMPGRRAAYARSSTGRCPRSPRGARPGS
jgi:CRP-like cAMP-binding protein